MINRFELTDWVLDCLKSSGGKVPVPMIAKWIWEHHEAELRDSGDLFYTWQYDMRWAGTRLSNEGKIVKDRDGWRIVAAV
jgi:hypothetical protein